MIPNLLEYVMPPEWEPHQRTFLSWPVRESMCYPEEYEALCRAYVELIKALTAFEPVTLVVNPGESDQVRRQLPETGVTLLPIPHSDAWLRDNGPTFLRSEKGTLAGVNWRFNAWGGKYAPWESDDELAPKLLAHYNIPVFHAPLVMEGGSFHVDGEGTLLTTEACLLNPNRNPDLTREEIEAFLKQYLKIEQVIWLKQGLSGDETDGHVDNLACFAAPGKVLLQVCNDPEDENYEMTRENIKLLSAAQDARGRKLEIIPIEQPPKAFYKDNRLALSYLNFYFVNGGILLPVFGGAAAKTDDQAEKTLASVFPDRRICRIDGWGFIREGGNVHCLTQQMPAAFQG